MQQRPNLGEGRCSSAPVPPRSSSGLAEEEAPGAGETNWPAPLRRRVIWPPASSGSLVSSAIWTIFPSQIWCSLLRVQTTRGSHMELLRVRRRGKAGAPLLKGQEPDIALRSCGQAQTGQMTSHRQEASVRRSLHFVASSALCSPTTGFCTLHLSCLFAYLQIVYVS